MSCALLVAAGGIGLYATAWSYNKFTAGVCKSKRDLNGRTAIVTGGNTGIGLETARNLAARNARVILACRTVSTAEKAMEDIIESTGNTNVVVKQVDISSFESVREFAKDILKNEERLDILVNNAGVMVLPEQQKSADGLEMIMATNHFGPFLLTNMLLPKLKECAPSRIVVVSSMVHEWAKMDFDNINGEKSFKMMDAYGRSKLANVLFTRELSERLKGTGVTVNALHPGAVTTDLTRNIVGLMRLGLTVIFKPFFKTAVGGAQTSIHLAVAEELDGVSGKYFSDCREKKLKKHALNVDDARRLWDYSEKVTNLAG